MAIIDDFKQRFPELAARADAVFPLIENDWRSYYPVDYESNKAAVLQLLAHLYVTQELNSSQGFQMVSSRSVGSVSESYSVPAAGSGFETTKYGKAFVDMTKHKQAHFFV